jgi:hypothetical protein
LRTEVVRVRPERPMEGRYRRVQKDACIVGVDVVADLNYWKPREPIRKID